MRKIITVAALSAAFLTAGGSAQAIENVYRPYIGVGYAYNKVDIQEANSYNNSGIINLGSTYNKYFSTELFYQYSDMHKYSATSFLKSSEFQAYGLDMMGYLPLGQSGKIAPTVTLGIGQYTFSNDFRNAKDTRDSGWGYRFGGGLTYNLSDNLAIRAIARYIKLDKTDHIDEMNEYSFGIRYTF